jgi:RNA polymerase sigma factor (TIGR02999 family)
MVPDDAERDPIGDEPAPAEPAAAEQAQGDVTLILSRIEQGDGHAAEELLPLVYEELRKLAATKMAQEKPGQTLQATALVHEAYIRLVNQTVSQRWDGRRHFFAAAAEAMRRILVESARHKGSLRAGGNAQQVDLDDVEPAIEESTLDLLALDEALAKLERQSPRIAELVKLRFFAGLSVRAAAAALGVNSSTVVADWAYAKSWLGLEMSGGSRS